MNVYSFPTELLKPANALALTNRKERHRLLRKADILKAAEHIFAQKGYHNATIQDIAREAQYATGTVYLYFTDKDALYSSILEEKMQGLFSLLKEKTEKVKGIREKLEILIFENLEFFEKNHDFFRILLSEEDRLSIKSKVAKLPVFIRHKEYLAGIIKQAQIENIIREDIEAKQISDVFGSILTSVIFSWSEERSYKKRDLREMAALILEMFLNGVKKR